MNEISKKDVIILVTGLTVVSVVGIFVVKKSIWLTKAAITILKNDKKEETK